MLTASVDNLAVVGDGSRSGWMAPKAKGSDIPRYVAYGICLGCACHSLPLRRQYLVSHTGLLEAPTEVSRSLLVNQ